ncbi:MAG: Gfo/Idh/MocA family oxidoreductase [Candidatus Cloacimonetes bacterium]|nr:Gfo/Idh/MocA family oxidoreductase [Candidatus Cloacimonadota bacterium]
MKKIKFGLIGCGRISANHFEAIASIDQAEIVTCSDTIINRAKESAEKYAIASYYKDYIEMLDKEKLNAVIIASPSGLHPEMGIEAANRKIHVITEKPMAIDLKSADKLVAACDKNKVQLFVVKQNRLNPSIQLLKKAIDKGRFGRLFNANATVRWTRPQQYYDMAKWRGTWEFDGGAFMNQASHYFDLIQWMMGPIESVMSFTATLNHNLETEDDGVGLIRFRNNALGVIEVTMNTFPKNMEGSITIMGENGTVKIGGIAVNKIEHWEFRDYDDDDKLIEQTATDPKSVYGFGHTGYLRNVVAALLDSVTPDIDGREGRKSLELILAMYESAKRGKRIALPLKY